MVVVIGNQKYERVQHITRTRTYEEADAARKEWKEFLRAMNRRGELKEYGDFRIAVIPIKRRAPDYAGTDTPLIDFYEIVLVKRTSCPTS